MMLATVSRQTALEQLAIEHRAVRGVIDALTEAEMTLPDTIRYGLYPDQRLSFKDLLAHLITYEVYALEAVDAWKRGQKHWSVEAMRSSSGSRDIHYGGIADRRDHTLAEVLAEWERTQAALKEMIRQLSDEDWHSPAPYETKTPDDLGGILEEILVAPPRPVYRHLPVHIPDTAFYIRLLKTG